MKRAQITSRSGYIPLSPSNKKVLSRAGLFCFKKTKISEYYRKIRSFPGMIFPLSVEAGRTSPSICTFG